MTDHDPRLIIALRDLRDRFPGSRAEITTDTIRVYADDLSEYPIELIVPAIREAGMRAAFFPTVSEITDVLANALTGGASGVDEAWVQVQREARRVGYNRPPEFHDGVFYENPGPTFANPMIAAAVESVGWKLICHGDNSKGDITKAFIFAYKRQIEDAKAAIKSGRIGIELRAAIAAGMGIAIDIASTSEPRQDDAKPLPRVSSDLRRIK